MLDAEGDCPAELGPHLLEKAQEAWDGVDMACVLARRMLENWIVAGATPDVLGGVNGLPPDVTAPADPEECNGAKWLDAQVRSVDRKRSYKKTIDAPVYVARMDLVQCRSTTPSFDKLCRELARRGPAEGGETEGP